MNSLCGVLMSGSVVYLPASEAVSEVTCEVCQKQLLEVDGFVAIKDGHAAPVVLSDGYIMRWDGRGWQMAWRGDEGWGA